jgi:hypothetical protein
MWSNCLFWAVGQWIKHGGCLRWEMTHYNKVSWLKWPHFYWVDDNGQAWEFHSKGPKRKILIPPPIFPGEPRKKDDAP